MFELEKGNPERLEGKVLVYTKKIIRSCCDSHQHLGIYSTTDLVDFMKFTGAEPYLESAYKKEFKYLRVKIKELEKEQKNPSFKIMPTFSRILGFKKLDDIREVKGDRISWSIVPDIHMAIPILYKLGELYMVGYFLQVESKIGPLKQEIESDVEDTYNQYSGIQLRKRLYQISGSLLDAISSKNERLQAKARANIKKFTEGANFFNDVVNIIGIAQTEIPNKVVAIEAYIDRIVAIKDERFEEITGIDEKLSALLKK